MNSSSNSLYPISLLQILYMKIPSISNSLFLSPMISHSITYSLLSHSISHSILTIYSYTLISIYSILILIAFLYLKLIHYLVDMNLLMAISLSHQSIFIPHSFFSLFLFLLLLSIYKKFSSIINFA